MQISVPIVGALIGALILFSDAGCSGYALPRGEICSMSEI